MPDPPRYDLLPGQYPATIRYFRADTGELVHTQTINGPGVVWIDPWAKKVGAPVDVEIEFADGQICRS